MYDSMDSIMCSNGDSGVCRLCGCQYKQCLLVPIKNIITDVPVPKAFPPCTGILNDFIYFLKNFDIFSTSCSLYAEERPTVLDTEVLDYPICMACMELLRNFMLFYCRKVAETSDEVKETSSAKTCNGFSKELDFFIAEKHSDFEGKKNHLSSPVKCFSSPVKSASSAFSSGSLPAHSLLCSLSSMGKSSPLKTNNLHHVQSVNNSSKEILPSLIRDERKKEKTGKKPCVFVRRLTRLQFAHSQDLLSQYKVPFSIAKLSNKSVVPSPVQLCSDSQQEFLSWFDLVSNKSSSPLVCLQKEQSISLILDAENTKENFSEDICHDPDTTDILPSCTEIVNIATEASQSSNNSKSSLSLPASPEIKQAMACTSKASNNCKLLSSVDDELSPMKSILKRKRSIAKTKIVCCEKKKVKFSDDKMIRIFYKNLSLETEKKSDDSDSNFTVDDKKTSTVSSDSVAASNVCSQKSVLKNNPLKPNGNNMQKNNNLKQSVKNSSEPDNSKQKIVDFEDNRAYCIKSVQPKLNIKSIEKCSICNRAKNTSTGDHQLLEKSDLKEEFCKCDVNSPSTSGYKKIKSTNSYTKNSIKFIAPTKSSQSLISNYFKKIAKTEDSEVFSSSFGTEINQAYSKIFPPPIPANNLLANSKAVIATGDMHKRLSPEINRMFHAYVDLGVKCDQNTTILTTFSLCT